MKVGCDKRTAKDEYEPVLQPKCGLAWLFPTSFAFSDPRPENRIADYTTAITEVDGIGVPPVDVKQFLSVCVQVLVQFSIFAMAYILLNLIQVFEFWVIKPRVTMCMCIRTFRVGVSPQQCSVLNIQYYSTF